MKIVIIDNYDSFTYNLSHLVKELGAEVTVLRNDCFSMEELEEFDKILLSRPGNTRRGRTPSQRDTHLLRPQAYPRCMPWRTGYRRSVRREANKPERSISRHTEQNPHHSR